MWTDFWQHLKNSFSPANIQSAETNCNHVALLAATIVKTIRPDLSPEVDLGLNALGGAEAVGNVVDVAINSPHPLQPGINAAQKALQTSATLLAKTGGNASAVSTLMQASSALQLIGDSITPGAK